MKVAKEIYEKLAWLLGIYVKQMQDLQGVDDDDEIDDVEEMDDVEET